jgi:lysozyme family protein
MDADTLFAAAVAIVLEEEGVFSDDARDPGGETWYGIARASHPDIPWPPTKEQALAIYRAQYWDAHRCGDMPWHWALAIFDAAVNPAPGQNPVRLAQTSLRITEDGEVGPGTLAAMHGRFSDDALDRFRARRAEGYMKSANFSAYGLGWISRTYAIQRKGFQRAPTS